MWGLKVLSSGFTNVGFESFYEGQWLRVRLCCRKLSDSIFWLYYFTPRWLAGAMPCPKKVHKKYAKKRWKQIKEENISFILSQNIAWCPKHPTVKSVLSVRRHYPKREVGSQKTWVFISFHRLQIRHSKILLILARPLLIGYFTFYYFSFSDFNRMDAWSLMRGDAFIHFVSGSRRVNIRLGVFC